MFRDTCSSLRRAVFLACAALATQSSIVSGQQNEESGSEQLLDENARHLEMIVRQDPPDDSVGCFLSSPPEPDTLGPKNRFLSFAANDPGRMQAIRVTFVALPAPFDGWNGAELWVGEPQDACKLGCCAICPQYLFWAATLQCDPFYLPWTKYGTMPVFHEGIIPGGSYRIQVIDETCPVEHKSSYSAPLDMTTAPWGDTVSDCSTHPCGPSDGVVSIVDIMAVIGRFRGDQDSIVKPRADLEPGCLDLVINITDALRGIGAFQGLPYPFTPTAVDPCDSTCVNPLPQPGSSTVLP